MQNARGKEREVAGKGSESVSDTTRDTLLTSLLAARGLTDEEEIDAFLSPDYDNHLHDPLLLTDMARAVSRILSAIENDERVCIYSDYDCDGIPGAVVLHDALRSLGCENFENYIPHRHEEGFGMNIPAVEKFAAAGTTLIITIDCGIADHTPVARANELGINVIITDHHEPSTELPPAHAILNPKRDEAYPFRELCGAGVVFKLVTALLDEARTRGTTAPAVGQEKWHLDMVGLATIADMVPLVGENRVLARYGLTVLRKSRRPGLQHLLRSARASQAHLTEDDVGFVIAPRINAASRMDAPKDAFHLLTARDEAEAGKRALHLERLNNERKGVVAAMAKEIRGRIASLDELPPVIVMGNPTWMPSLAGLAANTLAETYDRPTFLWGRDGQGVIKGSCRARGEASVVALMEGARDSFIEFGGHHGAGGFSVSNEKIHTLADALERAHLALCETAAPKPRTDTPIDADLALSDIGNELLRTLRALAPFGEGNPRPLFRFERVTPSRVEQFGKQGAHTKIVFDTPRGAIEAIAFFTAPDDFTRPPQAGASATLHAHVEETFFGGRTQTRLRLVDIV